MVNFDGEILLVGCGNMGGAMLRGWLAEGVPATRIIVQDPAPSEAVARLVAESGIRRVDAATDADLAGAPAVALMAVKPQVMDRVLEGVAPFFSDRTIVLSIAAGRTIASFEAKAPSGAPVIRTIPNTPAAIGCGITVCAGNAFVGARQRSIADGLLTALGEVAWVDDEALIDAATAVSGSGPAYVFLLAECLASAGEAVGLSPALAMQLARATVSGAGELLSRSSEDAAQLRRNVTSPGGTTQAALDVLMADDGLEPLLRRAVTAARDRSRALSS